jgi:hypothetical protein
MKAAYIILAAQPAETGYYLKHIANWSQVIILFALAIAAYFFLKKLFK